MFACNGNKFSDFETLATVKSYIVLLIAAIVACTPLVKRLSDKLKYSALHSAKVLALYSVLQIIIPILLLILSAAALVGNSYNPFLYFRF